MDYKDPEFYRQKSKEHYKKYKEKYNERNKEQRQRTKQIISESKSVGCFVCKEMEPACLDFHHVGNNKDYTVSQMLGMSDVKVKEEISKCVVLCANCHRKVHAGLINIGE